MSHTFNLQQEETNSLVNVSVWKKQHDTKADICKFPSVKSHFDGHDASMVFESRTRLSPNLSLVKVGLYFSLIKPALLVPTAVMLCFWVK